MFFIVPIDTYLNTCFVFLPYRPTLLIKLFGFAFRELGAGGGIRGGFDCGFEVPFEPSIEAGVVFTF